MCLAFLFLAAGLWNVPVVAEASIVMAAAAAVLAGWEAVRAVRYRNRYDLGALQEFHEKEELRQLDPGEVAEDADTVICINCGSPRPRRIPVCPHCRSCG